MPKHRHRISRRRGFLALAAAAVVLTSGCGTSAGPAGSADDARPLVLTTFTVLADIARNVAGEHLRVESITKVGAEIHGYQPTPGDLRRSAGAALILDNGLGLEAWFAQFVAGIDVPHVVVSEGVPTLPIADEGFGRVPAEHPSSAGEGAALNPHAWMSPLNVQSYVENIVDAFAELDPEHAREYAANGRAYSDRLQRVHDALVAELARLPEDVRALVTCEGAFSYLARDVGLREAYIWPVNSEQQATPQQMARVIEFVRENAVPAVFCESTVSDDPMQQVVRETGARFGGILYVDSLSQPDGPVPTYLALVQHAADTIVAGLNPHGAEVAQ